MIFLNVLFIFFLSQNETIYAAARSGDAQGARPINYRKHFDNLNEVDRGALFAKYKNERCVNKTGLVVSCGIEDQWQNGDPDFNWDPLMNQIPRGSTASVEIQCNPSDGKFYMSVKVKSKVCSKRQATNCKIRESYFQDPYTRAGGPLSDKPVSWLVSPGVYPDAETQMGRGRTFSSSYPTLTEYHVVSPRQEWEGAQMINAVWTGTGTSGGEALHASNQVDGYPHSRGCVRLSGGDAFAFYNLVRRIGTKNVSYNFSGYGPKRPSDGRPVCSGPPGHRERKLQEWASTSAAENKKSLALLDREFRAQIARTGRVPLTTQPGPGEPASTVMTPRMDMHERQLASLPGKNLCLPED